MPRNRMQYQKGLSDDAFERLYRGLSNLRNMRPNLDSAPHCERDASMKNRGIEITPEVLSAGVAELISYALPDGGREEYIRAVYGTVRAMARAAGLYPAEKW